jgi:hypothetical protein
MMAKPFAPKRYAGSGISFRARHKRIVAKRDVAAENAAQIRLLRATIRDPSAPRPFIANPNDGLRRVAKD